jgi:hypothetical protein
VLRIFIALKIPSPWLGFELATFGSSGQHTNHYTTKATDVALQRHPLFYSELSLRAPYLLPRQLLQLVISPFLGVLIFRPSFHSAGRRSMIADNEGTIACVQEIIQ